MTGNVICAVALPTARASMSVVYMLVAMFERKGGFIDKHVNRTTGRSFYVTSWTALLMYLDLIYPMK